LIQFTDPALNLLHLALVMAIHVMSIDQQKQARNILTLPLLHLVDQVDAVVEINLFAIY